MKLIAATASLALLLAPLSHAQAAGGVPINIIGGADDTKASQYLFSVREAFRSTSTFNVSTANSQGLRLLVNTIPIDVAGGHGIAFSIVFLIRDSQNSDTYLDSWVGTCADEDLTICARRIVTSVGGDLEAYAAALAKK